MKFNIINDIESPYIIDSLKNLLEARKLQYKVIDDVSNIKVNLKDVFFVVNEKLALNLTSHQKENRVFLIHPNIREHEVPEAYIFRPEQIDFIADLLDIYVKESELDQKILLYEKILSEYISFLASSKRTLSITNKTLKDVKNVFDGNYRVVVEMLEVLNIFLEIDNKLFGSENLESFINNLAIEIRKKGFGEKLEYIKNDKVIELFPNIKYETEVLCPLGHANKGFLYIKKDSRKSKELSEFFVVMLVKNIHEFMMKLENKGKMSKINTILEKAMSVIPYPISLFMDNGELLLHNQKFLGLNILPNICFNFKNDEKYDQDGTLYKVHRKEFCSRGEQYIYFIFTSDKEMSDKTEKNLSSSELGIISSSIAHELNNPLAGILAAIELILLEDDLDEEMLQSISEMRESARRSKELVEIFLGFSKKDPRYIKQGNLKTAFVQALGLLRFRMVESSVRLEMDVCGDSETFKKESNISVMAMIFYLILGEIITSFSRLGLIRSTNEHEEIIKGKFQIANTALEIYLEKNVGDLQILEKMKLLNYLIDLENLHINIADNTIILSI